MKATLKKLTRELKKIPTYLFFKSLTVITVLFYFPKLIYLLARQEKIIAFDWNDGLYGEMYFPLIEKLEQKEVNIVYFIDYGKVNHFGLKIINNSLPKLFGNLLDNKVVVSATKSKYKKLANTIRVQMFHGVGSFGVKFGMGFIEPFDVLFLQSASQRNQLETEYKDVMAEKKMYNVGYPKIDKFVTVQNERPYPFKDVTLFYGPTYHLKISSIFSFLETIVTVCQTHNFKLIIKLHPFLLNKYNFDQSGGIDWRKKVSEYKAQYANITVVKYDEFNRNLLNSFQMTDIFITDCSALGYEFVLATSKPILFLGKKLKIPLVDLSKGSIEKYSKYPEVYYRGKIGPIIYQPNEFETAIKKMIKKNDYTNAIESFRKEYIYNLGRAAEVGASKLLELHAEL